MTDKKLEPVTHTPNAAVHQERFINRETSWLAFNNRVLDEACNPNKAEFPRHIGFQPR